MNTKTYVAVILAALAAVVWTASALAASPWPSDPRVCSKWATSADPVGSATQRTHCAMHAAISAVRKHAGPADISCTKLGSTILHWLCEWGYANPIGYTAVFKHSNGQWFVFVKH
jgi:hypothetical protein